MLLFNIFIQLVQLSLPIAFYLILNFLQFLHFKVIHHLVEEEVMEEGYLKDYPK